MVFYISQQNVRKTRRIHLFSLRESPRPRLPSVEVSFYIFQTTYFYRKEKNQIELYHQIELASKSPRVLLLQQFALFMDSQTMNRQRDEVYFLRILSTEIPERERAATRDHIKAMLEMLNFPKLTLNLGVTSSTNMT